jgi:hypothetical protein
LEVLNAETDFFNEKIALISYGHAVSRLVMLRGMVVLGDGWHPLELEIESKILAWTVGPVVGSSGCLEFSSWGNVFEIEGRRSGGEPVDAAVAMMDALGGRKGVS